MEHRAKYQLSRCNRRHPNRQTERQTDVEVLLFEFVSKTTRTRKLRQRYTNKLMMIGADIDMPEIGRLSEVRSHHHIIIHCIIYNNRSKIGGGYSQKTEAKEGNPASLREDRQHQPGALRPSTIPN
jgi:hypothetical protein